MFRVTPKVFTPCLGALHGMWGTWCMVLPLVVRDGLAYGEVIRDGLAHWRWLTH